MLLKNLWLLFVSFTRTGVLGYGGGPSIIPLVQAEVVGLYKWMDMGEFADALAMGYALPGPIYTKMAAVVGYRVAGPFGMISALLGAVLPTALMIVGLFLFFNKAKDNPRIAGMINGIRPVVIALLLMVVVDMYPKALPNVSSWVIALVTFAVFLITNIHPAIAIIIGGIIGIIFF